MKMEVEITEQEINVNDGAELGARENKMNAAITYLETSLNVLETNEPINRAEGNIEQADLEAISILQIKEGIEALKSFGIV